MALERVGIGGVFTFKSRQAVRSLNQARDASGRFIKSQQRIVTGSKGSVSALAGLKGAFSTMGAVAGSVIGTVQGAVVKAGQSIRSLGVKFLALTAIVGFGTVKAANFEQQMDAVGAITGSTGADMAKLEKKAKQMGATTVFSATQSGQAMEFLGRAGASTDEIISGLGGVMNAAAADSIDLATAADIVARVVKAMGLEFSDANRVADVLALASARTNTNIIGLGEAFKFAAAQAKVMEIDLETTTALLGASADAGLRGSIGGTSFTNMLIKLARPSGKATKFMKENNIQMTKTAEGGLDIVDVLKQVNTVLEKETDVVKKAAMATELFGIRGAKSFAAISQAIKTGKVDKLIDQLGKAQGKAEEMATRRLSNFKGQITLLKSALEGLAIETTGMFLEGMASSLKSVTKQIGLVVQAMTDLSEGTMSNEEMTKKYGATVLAVARGIREGLETVKWAINSVGEVISALVNKVAGELTPGMAESIAKWTTVMILAAAISAPFLIVLGTIIIALAGIIPFVILFQQAFMVAGIVAEGSLLGIIAAFKLTRKEGEGFGKWSTRMWTTFQKKANWVKKTGLEPLRNYFELELIPTIKKLRDRVRTATKAMTSRFKGLFDDIKKFLAVFTPLWEAAFRQIQVVAITVFDILMVAAENATTAFETILGVLGRVFDLVQRVGRIMAKNFVTVLQTIAKVVVAAADATGITISPKLKEFATKDFTFERERGGVGRTFQPRFQFKGVTPPTADPAAAGLAVATAAVAAAAQIGAAAGAAAKAKKPDKPCIDLNLTDKRKVQVETKLDIDGQELARSMAKTQVELQDRRGFRATPWQRRITLEHNAIPLKAFG